MFKFSNFSHWKTTLIGVLLLVFGCFLQYYLIEKSVLDINYPVVGIIVAGLGLIFLPDTVLDVLRKIILKKGE